MKGSNNLIYIIMNAKNLKLGYQYQNNDLDFFFEYGLYIVCGFLADETHVYKTFSRFSEAKKYFLKN